MPERRLSGQLYPFFRPNQNVVAGAAYVWDDHGDQPWNAVAATDALVDLITLGLVVEVASGPTYESSHPVIRPGETTISYQIGGSGAARVDQGVP